MRRAIALSILLSIVILGALFLNANLLTAKSANFVGTTIYIRADGSIDPSDAPVDVHGTTYTLTGDIQCPQLGYCIFIERSNILLDGYGYTIEGWNPQDEPSASGNGIYVGSVNNVEIRNIIIDGCVSGIEAQSVSGARIHNTTIDGKYQPEKGYEACGIFLLQCEGVGVDGNRLVNNYASVLVQSSNCMVTNNRIMDNAGAGVYLAGSNVTVVSNFIARNDIGIEISGGSNNLLKANDVLSNKRVGVFLGDSANNVLVENNIAGQNGSQGYGVQMNPYGSGNTFYHNDFANNYVHVEGGDLATVANVWDNDYPSGGNYWDTYRGVDNYRGSYQNETGNDGIGDTSYQITQANRDRYPLMTLFRPIPDISEAAIARGDYSLVIIIAAVIVAGTIVSVLTLYRRRKKKQGPQENLPSPQKTALLSRFIVPVLSTLSMIVIFNFASISTETYGLGAVGLFGGALYFDEILIGFLSSAIGVIVTWKIIIRQKYATRRLEELLSAAITSFLFVAYLLAYTTYRPFELFGLLQAIQPTLVMTWTFATTLIGCCLGFLLGGVGLKRMQAFSSPATQPEEHQRRAYSYLGGGLALIFTGLLSGYVAGFIVWAFVGQVQAGLGAAFPYASEFPPPLSYILVWAVFGGLMFPVAILFRRVRHS